eukprot:scaffold28674_cov104-Isochrysis_galbana.AAC.1
MPRRAAVLGADEKRTRRMMRQFCFDRLNLAFRGQGQGSRVGCGSISCLVGPCWPHIACTCSQVASRPRKGCEKAPAC